LGKGAFLVAEADESDGSFLHLHPTIAVVTNIDPEHLTHYKDYEELKEAFVRFCSAIPFYGAAVFCTDHPASAKIAENFSRRYWTYGLKKTADFMAKSIRFEGPQMRFNVLFRGKTLGEVQLKLPGQHNVSNALAAIAVAHELGIPFNKIRRALKNFKGIARRLEVLFNGAPINQEGLEIAPHSCCFSTSSLFKDQGFIQGVSIRIFRL
jgi:UDP-N-acetylmuramate--alanine ligase